jgi:hypothetical protein
MPASRHRVEFFAESMRRLRDDRKLRRPFENAASRLVAVHFGHLDVHQHKVEGALSITGDPLDGFAPVVHHDNPRPVIDQVVFEDHPVDFFILSNQEGQAGQRLGINRRGLNPDRRRCFGRCAGDKGQPEFNGRPLARLAVYDNAPLHQFDDALADRQPQTATAKPAGGRSIGLLEGFEQQSASCDWLMPMPLSLTRKQQPVGLTGKQKA